MKLRSFLIFATLSIISIASFAQEWAPLGTKWHYTQSFAEFDDLYFVRLASVDTTRIHNKHCKKIEINNTTCTERPTSNYIHVDSNKVFYLDDENEEFRLLYDFNVTKGDSWEILVSVDDKVDTLIATVDSVGSTNINTHDLKTMFVTYSVKNEGATYGPIAQNDKIIEFIGSTNYFFPWVSGVCDLSFAGPLRCYEDEKIGYFNTGLYEECDYVTDIENYSVTKGIKIYPNPFKDRIYLSLANQNEQIQSVHIYNSQGREVLKKQIINKNEFSLDMQTFTPGVYSIVLLNNNGTRHIDKIIKQ